MKHLSIKFAPIMALAIMGCSNTDAYQTSAEPAPTETTQKKGARLQFDDTSGSGLFYGLDAVFDFVIDPDGDGECDDAVFNDQTIVATETTTVNQPELGFGLLSDDDYCLRMSDASVYIDPDDNLNTNNWDEVTDEVELVSDNPIPVSITTGTIDTLEIVYAWNGGEPFRWGRADLKLQVLDASDCSNECLPIGQAPDDAGLLCLNTGDGAMCHPTCTLNSECQNICPFSDSTPDDNGYCLRGALPPPYPGVCVCEPSTQG